MPKPQPAAERDTYIVKPVLKALQVLTCLADAGRELRLSEIVQLAKLPKTTVYKYLHTLRRAGFVTHDDAADVYRLGARAWSLGRGADDRMRVREIARPLMRELRDRTGETVNLGVFDGHDVIYLEMAQSRQNLRMQATIGAHDPAYSTALGKAMLAFLPESEWARRLPSHLAKRTARTITGREALRADLAATRKRGFSIDRGENEDGALCVGAPIRNQDGNVVAALSVSAPAYRVDLETEREFADAVTAMAREISHRMGHME